MNSWNVTEYVKYYETKNQFVCKVKPATDSTHIMIELRPRKAASLITFLAALLSNVAAKTDAGKKLLNELRCCCNARLNTSSGSYL